MRNRIVGWFLFAAVVLGSSTVCGWIARVVIGPRKPDYTRFYNSSVRTVPVRTTGLNRTATNFGEFTEPNGLEKRELIEVLSALSSTISQPQHTPPPLPFHYRRMAEEELALGQLRSSNNVLTVQDLGQSEQAIRNSVQALRQQQPECLDLGPVESLSASFSSDRQETLVLAKHRKRDPIHRETVQYRRWWLTRSGGSWQGYDFDLPISHIRFLAVHGLLSQELTPNLEGAVPSPTAFHGTHESIKWLSLAAKVDDYAGLQALAVLPKHEDTPYVRDLRFAQHARLETRSGKLDGTRINQELGAGRWVQTPLMSLARAVRLVAIREAEGAREALKGYRNQIGDAPIAYRVEAELARLEHGDSAEAVAVLRKGLKEFPGNVELLIDLTRQVRDGERIAIGEEFARSADETGFEMAQKLWMESSPEWMADLCEGYLRVKPDDEAALKCQRLLAAKRD